MPDTCSALHFSKWRHDGLNYLEAHDRWNHGTAFLHDICQQTVEIFSDGFDTVILSVNAESIRVSGQDTVKWWDYKAMGKELYQVVSCKLNVECYSDFQREDDSNGWEMWRLLT